MRRAANAHRIDHVHDLLQRSILVAGNGHCQPGRIACTDQCADLPCLDFPSFGKHLAALADLAYVLNSGEASISVIDSTTRAELRRIPVLREPHHLMMSLDGRHLLVGDSAGNELLSINPDTAEVVRRERLSNPYHMGYSPDGKLLVVNSLRQIGRAHV